MVPRIRFGVGGYVLARRALSPIVRLATDARRLTADRLHERLTAPTPNDEIGRLTAVINDTFARLESSFDQLKRFTADASHELRTPLSVVRGIGEAAVAERRSPAEYLSSFFRIDEARTRDGGGAGLGLAIAKWAVDVHGGQITVSDRPGGGAEFRILLPRDPAGAIHTTQPTAGGSA